MGIKIIHYQEAKEVSYPGDQGKGTVGRVVIGQADGARPRSWGTPFTFAVLALHELKALFQDQCFATPYGLTYP